MVFTKRLTRNMQTKIDLNANFCEVRNCITGHIMHYLFEYVEQNLGCDGGLRFPLQLLRPSGNLAATSRANKWSAHGVHRSPEVRGIWLASTLVFSLYFNAWTGHEKWRSINYRYQRAHGIALWKKRLVACKYLSPANVDACSDKKVWTRILKCVKW